MKDDFMKFMERVKTDENLQKKLEEAGKNYTGEQTEEAVFNSVVVPIAKKAGFSIDLDDTRQPVQELNLDEMEQVDGGFELGAGVGLYQCHGLGGGLGFGFGDGKAGGCIIIGGGNTTQVCAAVGDAEDKETIKTHGQPPI